MESRIYFEKFVSEDDFKYFLNLVLNEKVMVMNYGRIFTLEEAENVYKHILKRGKRHSDFGDYKVFERSTGSFIGTGAIVINSDFNEAEVEYMLLPEYWGKGYGSEIVRELLKKAEGTESVQKVTAIIEPNNVGSKKILLNNGFVSCKTFKIDDGSLAEMLAKKMRDE